MIGLLKLSAAAMLAGYLLELIVGWPNRLKHPIVMIGGLISFFERTLRGIFPKTPKGERAAGFLMAALVPLISCGIPAVILWVGYVLHPLAGCTIETLMCWSIFAAGSLKQAAMDVKNALDVSLEDGRRAVSMIVGRDTQALSETGVIKATVETVAENTSDGIASPAFFTMLGGAAFGYFYKAVNTMDSMCGYKNDRYRYFGTGGARLDDVCNFLPARLCGLVMILCAGFCGLDGKGAFRIFRRDRYNHASPNSAQTESVMAGALNVQLAGDAWYFGKKVEKPTIGDDIRPIERADIDRSCRLMTVTSTVLVVLGALARVGLGMLIFR